MKQFNIHQAKAQLSRLIEQVMLGEQVVIAKGNKPVAKLVAVESQEPRQPGSAKDKLIYIAPDFDETPEDFKDYMP